MSKCRSMFALGMIFSIFILGTGQAQEKKEERKKGFLPANFGKLGLSVEQKQKIYGIQAKYKSDLDELNKKIKKVTEDQRADIYGVLSSDQKEKLKEITGFGKKDSDDKSGKNDVMNKVKE